MVAPVSLIVTAFARVADVRRTLTPQLKLDEGKTELWLLDLGAGKNRLGGSAWPKSTVELAASRADVDDADCSSVSSPRSGAAMRAGCCWPITTAPMAAPS